MPLRCFNIFAIFIFLLGSSLCSHAFVNVVVSIVPQKFFVKKIAGNRVNICVVVPPGYNPAIYDPNPSQMKKIEKAKIFFTIGVPYERRWVKRFLSLNKDLVIVRTDRGIKKRKITFDWLNPGKEMLDPHIWLSPPLVKKQAKIIASSLEQIDPEGKGEYRRNLKKFLSQIDTLDREIKDILKGKKGRAFLVFHPCWGYFAERYGLKQVPVEIQGKEPSGMWLARLISYCKQMDIRMIFVQPQFSQKAAKLIATELGARLVFIDPLAENWIENLKDVAKKIAEAISSS